VRFPLPQRYSVHYYEAITSINKENIMLLTIAIILAVLWALGFLAFHITAGVIHLLLVIAVIVLIVHFIRGRRAV
jgi:hypothetical protein